MEEQWNQAAAVGGRIILFKISNDKYIERDPVCKILLMLGFRFLKATQFPVLVNPVGI